MNRFLEKLRGNKEQVFLPESSKQRIRNAVAAFVREHPVVSETVVHPTQQRSFFMHVRAFFARPMFIPALVVLLFVAGAGTTLAAHDAMPGDMLYPVRINVTEKVFTGVVLSEESKAQAHVELFEDRLDEAVALTAEDKMTSEVALKLETLFDTYESNARKRIHKLEDKGNTAAAEALSARLEAIVDTHERILSRMENKHSAELRTSLKAKLEQRKTEAQTTKPEQKDTSASEQEKKSAENKINAAATILANAGVYIGKHGDGVTAESKAHAENTLAEAQELLDKARHQLQRGETHEAFLTAQSAIRVSQEAKTVLRLDSKFQVHVNVNSNTNTSHSSGKVEGVSNTEQRGRINIDDKKVEVNAGHNRRLQIDLFR